ncbi:nascent polypeptide-associated complex subunit alpha, muscle-specific form-like isoform X2 [Prinia subflava]|uniref:nascent polypeptide-associated complex subunit alpha, muscle-specific form-like isoform X2 n=1 Tax=Prinia subflava TaxID=208062 RepID=UPI002FE1C916
MSRGVGPPSPADAAAPRAGTLLGAERDGAAGTAPGPAVPASRRWCRALLLLAACVCATAVPYSLAALAAVTRAPPDSSASQRGGGDTPVTSCGGLLTSGCFPGLQRVVTAGTGVGGQSLGTQTGATQTPLTSLQWQPGSGDGLRLGTAMAVTLSPAQWPAKGVPAPSALLLQTEGVPSPGSWHHLAQGGLQRAGPGSHGATQLPAVTPAGGLGQLEGTAEPQTPQKESKATSRAWSEPAAGVPVTSQVWLHPPSLLTAASGPSAGAAVMRVAPNQPVPPQGAAAGSQVPPNVPTWALMDARSWSPSTAERVVASALPTQGTPSPAKLRPGTVWVPPALTPEGLWGSAGTALPGKAAPLVDAALAQDAGNGSGLLDAALASPPSTATAPGAQHMLVSSHATAEPGAPAVTSGTQSEWPSPPAQPMSTGASPAQTPAGPTVTGMSSTATGVIPELGQMSVVEESRHSKARTASVEPASTPAGSPGPASASPGSVLAPCSTNPALEHGSEPGHHTATTSSVTSPACLPTSPGAGHAANSLLSSQTLAVPTGVTLDVHVMSNGSSTSQHSSTAMEHLPAATREASSLAEMMTMGKPGSTEPKPPASPPFPTQPVLVLPLQFRLLGVTYTPALGSRNSESYRQLEEDVRLMLNQLLSSYKSFLQANVLEFMNGSVVVRGEVLFQGDAPAPTNSHLIRTLLTEASKGRSIFSWQLEPHSIQSGGFSLENLEPEKLSISLTGSQLGTSREDLLEWLVREVISSVSALYHVRNFTISQLRTLSGNTEIAGDLYLDTVVHADAAEVLEALTVLSDLATDLTSLSVEGYKIGLRVYPISFLVTNRHFSQKLQDPLSEEHHNLSRHLGDVVTRALRDYPTLLKVIIKEFLGHPGPPLTPAGLPSLRHRPHGHRRPLHHHRARRARVPGGQEAGLAEWKRP